MPLWRHFIIVDFLWPSSNFYFVPLFLSQMLCEWPSFTPRKFQKTRYFFKILQSNKVSPLPFWHIWLFHSDLDKSTRWISVPSSRKLNTPTKKDKVDSCFGRSWIFCILWALLDRWYLPFPTYKRYSLLPVFITGFLACSSFTLWTVCKSFMDGWQTSCHHFHNQIQK
jgi:hypothetical protein